MTAISQTLFFLSIAFVGYLIGRWGHAYLNVWLGNPRWAPHHWIYGAILMFLGIVYLNEVWAKAAFSFGLGHFISDLKDFFQLKIIGPDEEGPKKFWGID